MGLRTTGYREMSAEMRLLADEVQKSATRKAVRAGAEVILAAIEERMPPVGSIPGATSLPVDALKSDMVVVFDRVDKLGFLRAWIGPDKYSHVMYWVEFGHRLVTGGYSSMKRGKLQGSGHEIGDVPAHPVIRPATEASQTESLAAFTQELRAQLRKWIR